MGDSNTRYFLDIDDLRIGRRIYIDTYYLKEAGVLARPVGLVDLKTANQFSVIRERDVFSPYLRDYFKRARIIPQIKLMKGMYLQRELEYDEQTLARAAAGNRLIKTLWSCRILSIDSAGWWKEWIVFDFNFYSTEPDSV